MNGFYYAYWLFVFKQLLNPYHNKTQAHFNASLRFIIFSLFTLYARSPCELNRSANSANGEAAPEGGKCSKRKASIVQCPPLCGALLDEGVKNNMPVACFLPESPCELNRSAAARTVKLPRRRKCGKRKVSINCGLPLCGALLDEGVKNNMPVAYCLARESLRAEPERQQRER